jgi:hypothetical protein
VLILQCKSKQATEHFFSPMPWTAMPHLASMGARDQDLMAIFGLLTIPALVLLDGNGAVMCLDGQCKITKDPAGLGFPSGQSTHHAYPPNHSASTVGQVNQAVRRPHLVGCRRWQQQCIQGHPHDCQMQRHLHILLSCPPVVPRPLYRLKQTLTCGNGHLGDKPARNLLRTPTGMHACVSQ